MDDMGGYPTVETLHWVNDKVDTKVAREGAALAFAASVNSMGHAFSALFNALCYGLATLCFLVGNGVLHVREHVMNEQAGKDGPPPAMPYWVGK